MFAPRIIVVMGGAVSAGLDHDDLIDKLRDADYIKTKEMELVFRAVDRGFYFLPESREAAYRDLAWRKGNIHLSAPCIYGEVMECLQLKPGLSFLNLGSGTGYLSTMVGLVLGPYGINHGVELHEDVVEYANAKLVEFKETSPALDCYEFCEPSFVQGNSLCLSGNSRRYDRVYCGAACPENHENYMKNLLKVGGILVMPLNDQLMQITRVSENTWSSNSVLSVSFATLQTPPPGAPSASVKLPEVEPLSLQELCRSAIRSLLRQRAIEECPNIAVRQRKRYRKRKRRLPELIIPIREEEGVGGILDRRRGMNPVNLVVEGDFGLLLSRWVAGGSPIHPLRRQLFRSSTVSSPRLLWHRPWCLGSPREGECSCGGEQRGGGEGRGRRQQTSDSDEDEEDEVEVSSGEEDLEEEEAFDEESTENEGEEEGGDTEEEEPGRTEEAEIGEEEVTSERKRKVAKREKFDSGICTDMDNTQEGGATSSSLDSTNSVDYLKVSDISGDEESTMEVESPGTAAPTAAPTPAPPKARASGKTPPTEVIEVEPVPTYPVIMREKISLLPLPTALKEYLNFYRPF